MPKDFTRIEIWRHGPQWLVQDESTWPQLDVKPCSLPELRKPVPSNALISIIDTDTELLSGFSSIRTLIRTVAYCRRFYHNARGSKKLSGELSIIEYKQAYECIIKHVQRSEFLHEVNQLTNGDSIDNKSKLLNLTPFLDKGIIRVGGRLTNSGLNFHQKHPIVLPRNHTFTNLIIREQHEKLYHAGGQATLYAVRELYWPLDGRKITRKTIRQCVTCVHANPQEFQYTMGNLPADRVNYSRPFSIIGVDYCGPFFIKEKRYRNTKTLKCYVAVFVCFITRAVHLELVSDLTTDAFLGSLKKLFARRGKASKIYSDNATNFVGANRQLKELEQLLNSDEHKQKLKHFFDNEKITWKFSPPRAPHFGGLWEAVVKSFKHHFTRTVGNVVLTFEQLQIYVYEIEAILNSRPLTPLSSDPNDLLPLTPGHFLIGCPLTALPEEDLLDVKPGRLSLWQHAQEMRQHFWQRWQKEYVNELITRSKWKSGSSEIKIGTLVVLKEDNLPPMQWKMGRIIDTHPGPDGVIRVVTVRTTTGTYKRSIKQLCPLPVESSD